jgi:hypothetical protein
MSCEFAPAPDAKRAASGIPSENCLEGKAGTLDDSASSVLMK